MSSQTQRTGRNRIATVVSLTALCFSGLSLYETVLKQPRLTLYTAVNWQYGRAQGLSGEQIVAPVTIANHGAREAAVVSLELAVEKPGGGETVYVSTYTMGQNGLDQPLFAPAAIPGRSAYTGIVVFTPVPPDAVTARGPGTWKAKLRLRTTYNNTYRFLDDFFYVPPKETALTLKLDEFDEAGLSKGRRERLTAEASAR